MKSPKYILKRPHLERQQQEEYTQHINRIQTISRQKIDITQKFSDVYGLLQMCEKNRKKSSRFREEEKSLLQRIENRSLSNKCNIRKSQISDSPKHSSPLQSVNYFDRPLVKKEQTRIFNDNQILAKRILGQLPMIQKEKQDQQYNKHVREVQSLRKYHRYISNSPERSLPNNNYDDYMLSGLKAIQKNNQRYSMLNTNNIRMYGIIVFIEIIDINFKSLVMQQCSGVENLFFYEICIGQEQIIRSLPLTFEEFTHVSFYLFVKESQFDSEIIIKVWKAKGHMEIFLGQNRQKIIDIKNMLDSIELENKNPQQFQELQNKQSFVIQKNTIVNDSHISIKWKNEYGIYKFVEAKDMQCGTMVMKYNAKIQKGITNKDTSYSPFLNIDSYKQIIDNQSSILE